MPDGTDLPQIKISELPVGTQANLTDQLEANQAGISASLTVAQVATAVAGTLPAPPVIPTTLPPSGPAGGALNGTYPNPGLVGGPLSNYALISSLPTTLPPSGAAGGDLQGTYPNPTLKTTGTLANYLPLAGGSMAAAASIGWTGRSQISSPADGNFLLRNNAGTSFGYLQFGGTTNAFPALYRNGNQISVLLADGSAFATLNANNFNVQNGLFYGVYGSITSPGVDGQFEFFNNAGTAATRLDIATDGTIKFRNRTNTADAIATMATMPGTQNDNTGATTAFVKTAIAAGAPPSGAAGGALNGSYPNPGIVPGSNGQVMTTVSGAAAWAAPGGGPPTGAAGGILSGTYPNPAFVSGVGAPLVLASEQVLAATVNAFQINYPGTARLVEIWFDLLLTPLTDAGIFMKAVQNGTPNTGATSYNYSSAVWYTGSVFSCSQASAAYFGIVTGVRAKGVMRLTQPSTFEGVANYTGINAANTIFNYQGTNVLSPLTGVNGVQVTTAGTFAIGSYLRCLVLP